ncbi:hypothetical protein BABINDRAFT_159377 [Babjeviella inositovora NRRL Y-12698]|uniref:D-lactate dehydrogenase (cytochrome) n=1 Tax=Babjeviella inositovora NRRL Y-12698 TaxID=984486 RepID=A0A1E3R0I3_9ASCO|nr:uncharacterized protein BABINDRAFT_159377 [Babjeviella inositovora NRRL Y-12698]ODQ82882.1 hypothetical protein BABINDRAFT_159377 [Babjeviella inositovora NRRL Y-12698]
MLRSFVGHVPCARAMLSKRLQSSLGSAKKPTPVPKQVAPSEHYTLNQSSSAVATVLIGVSLLGGGIFIGSNFIASPKDDASELLSITPLSSVSSPEYGTAEDFKKAFREIEALVGSERVSRSDAEIDHHADSYYTTHKPLEGQKPQLVVFPATTEEVSAILKICHRLRVPVVPNSGLTSLEGHYIHSRLGLSLDLSGMNKILELNELDLDITVEAGVDWQGLNEYLEEYNLFFGPDPGPGAQIGGMCATSCSGTNAYRYGTMKENVLSLTVVLADGTVIKTRKRPRKTAAGYNLNGLFIGSEGTLGVVTQATLKLYMKPTVEAVGIVSFPTLEDAASAAHEYIRLGLPMNAIEILDETTMRFINATLSQKCEEMPTLFLKVGGSSETIVGETIKQVTAIAGKNHKTSSAFSFDESTKAELWHGRKVAFWSTYDYGRAKFGKDTEVWTTDIVVPISNLPQAVREIKEDLVANNFEASLMGHIGDGNLHFCIIYRAGEREKCAQVVGRMVEKALRLQGTCTGEHGIGMGKRNYLIQELGEEVISVMRRLKLSLDPLRIMNPDKIFKIDPEDHEH